MKIKETWDNYGDLIKTLAALFVALASAAIFVANLVLSDLVSDYITADRKSEATIAAFNAAVDARISEKVGQAESVSTLTTSVALNTDAINDLDASVGDLGTDIRELNSDVKDTLRLLVEGQ